MKSEDLFKQLANFERKTQQLEKCDDSMSDSDWNTLEDKLDKLPDTHKKIAKLASRFVKIASSTDPDDEHLFIKPNEGQKRNAVDLKSNWIIDIDPSVFLDMTTSDGLEKWEIINRVSSLKDLLTQERIVHPFLVIEKESGKIKGHEGRHRAAATLLKAKGSLFRIALQLRPGGRNYRSKDMPLVWIGEFNAKTYDIKSLMDQGKIKLVDDAVQKEFWRDDEQDY